MAGNGNDLDSGKWKSKYFEALEDLEIKENDWQDADQVLRRALGRLAAISHGIDNQLDDFLSDLRKALQRDSAPAVLLDHVEKISSYVKGLEEPSNHEHGAHLPPPDVVLRRMLDSVEFPESLSSRVDKLKAALDAFDDGEAFDDLAGEFSHLIERALGDSEGVESVQDIFLEFIECLSFPINFAERVQALKENLLSGIAPGAVNEVTHNVIALVVDMRAKLEQEKKELEDFLKQMGERLQDLDEMVMGAETHRMASLEGGRQLDAKVKEQVADIESTVQQAQDIDSMKSAIQMNLDNIRSHLAQQREQEELRQQDLEIQLIQLKKRMKAMEGESLVLQKRIRKERAQALRDPLTGAPNRLAYEQRVVQEFARWQRYQQPFTLMLCDVDHFKRINDEYGHRAGDRALVAIVKTLEQHLRETDFLARVGGEEFVVLLPETSLEDAKAVAEKLRASVEKCSFVYQGTPVPVTASGGYSQFKSNDTVEKVYQRADEALYRAKRQGRNRFVSIG